MSTVEARGGEVVVIGGVEIQEWPNEAKGKFRLAVHVLGNKGRAGDAPQGER